VRPSRVRFIVYDCALRMCKEPGWPVQISGLQRGRHLSGTQRRGHCSARTHRVWSSGMPGRRRGKSSPQLTAASRAPAGCSAVRVGIAITDGGHTDRRVFGHLGCAGTPGTATVTEQDRTGALAAASVRTACRTEPPRRRPAQSPPRPRTARYGTPWRL